MLIIGECGRGVGLYFNFCNCTMLCFSHQLKPYILGRMLSIYRVKKLKSTPIYVKPQLTSDSGTCRISVLVGIRNDPGKTIDSITVQFQLPPCILSADLTSNHGAVNIFANQVVKFWYYWLHQLCVKKFHWSYHVNFVVKDFFFSEYMWNQWEPKKLFRTGQK